MSAKYYIDIHSHILPGVDDGAKDIDMSAQMLDVAWSEGIRVIIVTPHNKADRHCVSPEGVDKRLQILRKLAKDAGYAMKFYPGNELMYDSSLPERLANGEVLTLADTDCVLVEFNPGDEYAYIVNGLRAISYEGYQPILAHCERYLCILKDIKKARELERMGILLQCNAASIKPKLLARNPETKFINALLKEQLVSFIATDAHRPEGRAPLIKETADYLYRHYDESYVDEILYENAKTMILEGRL